MAKSKRIKVWFKNALGWFGVVLFLSDTGSDSYVGYSLINRCHNYYGSSMAIPVVEFSREGYKLERFWAKNQQLV